MLQQQEYRTVSALQSNDLREALLGLHHAVIEHERRAYEKMNGRQSGAGFLQVLAYDAAYQWLSPLGQLIVTLDEGLDESNPAIVRTVGERARVLVRRELDPAQPFSLRYVPLIDLSPEIALAHAKVLTALRRLA
ncbi:MAG: hypothetical protein ABI831_23310 [Betaproteobacteria bacterium]